MDNQQETQSNQEADQDIENQEDAGHNNCTQEKCKAVNNTNDYCAGNFCLVCRINMGDGNPRQLCRKTYCPDDK
jgi:hypothetical protein